MSILPPEVRAGYVYNRVLRAIGDRPEDEDRFPDGIPAKGTVTFTPKNSVKQVVSNNTGVTVTREPVVCTIHQGEDNPDLAGLLIDEAGAVGGVWLVVGEWTVSYQFEDRYSNVPNQDIVVTEEYTEDNPLDVALVAGLTPSPTIKFVVNEQIYVDTLAARDEVQNNLHNMVISGEVVGDDLQLSRHGGDTIVAGNVRGPRGSQGPQGPMGTLELIGGDNPAITVDTSVGTRVFVGDTMIHGDTGWRDISDLLTDNWETIHGRGQSFCLIRRTGNTVHLNLRVSIVEEYNESRSRDSLMAIFAGSHIASGFHFPSSFSPIGTAMFYSSALSSGPAHQGVAFTAGGFFVRFFGVSGNWSPGDGVGLYGIWETSSQWPTTLPGTPD